MRVRQLGIRRAKPSVLLHHHASALHLGIGEVARIRGVDLAVDAGRASPGQQNHARVRRAEVAGAGVERGVDVSHPADPEPEPGMDGHLLGLTAGGDQQVAVAAGIDHHVGQDRLAPGLRLEDDAPDAVAFDDRVGSPHVEEQIHPRFEDHLVQDLPHHLGVVGDRITNAALRRGAAPDEAPASVLLHQRRIVGPPVGSRRGKGAAGSRHPLDELLAQAPDHRPPLAIVERQEQRDQAAGGQTAEGSVALDQRHLGTRARGGHGRRRPGTPPAHHQHLGPLQDGRLTRRLEQHLLSHGSRFYPTPNNENAGTFFRFSL